MLARLPEPALEPAQNPTPLPEPVWEELEPLEESGEPTDYEPAYAEWPDLFPETLIGKAHDLRVLQQLELGQKKRAYAQPCPERGI